MKNQDLILKLKSLKNTNPDQKFLSENRELLLSQISNTGDEKMSGFSKVLITSSNLVRLFSKPAFALGAFVLVLLGANYVSSNVLENSKPNDSLYIARIISERVKVNTTFDAIEREKLAIRYALRHAEDIASILSDEDFNVEDNSDRVAQLSDSFITEVNKVESRLTRLQNNKSVAKIDNTITNEGEGDIENPDDLISMTIADSNKDDNGIEIYIPETDYDDTDTIMTMGAVNDSLLATSSSEESGNSEQENVIEELIENNDLSKSTIDEVRDLVKKKEFSKALEKLNEAVLDIK